MLTQLSFLTSLVTRLKEAPEKVVEKMGVVKERLTSAENLRVFMAADVSALPQDPPPLEAWTSAFSCTR